MGDGLSGVLLVSWMANPGRNYSIDVLPTIAKRSSTGLSSGMGRERDAHLRLTERKSPGCEGKSSVDQP